MYTLLLIVWVAVLAAVVLGATFAVASGYGASMPAPERDRAPLGVPPEGPLTADDLAALRLPGAVRGYRMDVVDAVLDRLQRQLREQESTGAPGTSESAPPLEPWLANVLALTSALLAGDYAGLANITDRVRFDEEAARSRVRELGASPLPALPEETEISYGVVTDSPDLALAVAVAQTSGQPLGMLIESRRDPEMDLWNSSVLEIDLADDLVARHGVQLRSEPVVAYGHWAPLPEDEQPDAVEPPPAAPEAR